MAQREFLVAVDLADGADEVLTAARQLAEAQDGKLRVINVVRPLNLVYRDLGLAPVAANYENFEANVLASAEANLIELASEYGVTAENCTVLLGSPASEIRSHAEDRGSEIIVIGTHGRHGLGLLLGSTANAVLHGVPCDIFIVRIHPASATS